MTTRQAGTGQATGTVPVPAEDPAPTTAPFEGRVDDRGDRPAARVGRAAGRAAVQAARGTRRAIRRHPTADRAYRVGVGTVGGTAVALGVVLIPTPGPGVVVGLGGLAILATEFEGARKVSQQANATARRAYRAAKESRQRRADGER